MLKVASNSPASCALAYSPTCASQISYHVKKYLFFPQEGKDLINLKMLMLYGRILVAHCGGRLQSNSAGLLSHLTTHPEGLRAQGTALDSHSIE